MTLREGNREYFYEKLDKHFPGLKNVYQKKYGLNYQITSDNNNKLMKLLRATCEKHNIVLGNNRLFEYMGTFEEKQKVQMELF
jgi:peroxiredoxin